MLALLTLCAAYGMQHPLSDWERNNFVSLHLLAGCREVGILLMAFTPLDGALSGRAVQETWTVLLTLFVLGSVLFLYGVLGERRLHNAL